MSVTTSSAATADALAALFEEHHDRLLRLCRRQLGPGGDVEDVAHDVLLKAWAALPRFDTARPMWPWLATIARRTCIDHQRRHHLSTTRRGLGDGDATDPHEASVASWDRAGIVRTALERLSPASQELLLLRDAEGWSYERIADSQARRPGAVRMAVARARRQLGGHIEELARARGDWPLAGVTGALGIGGGRLRQRLAAAGSALRDALVRGAVGIDAAGAAGLAFVVPAATSALLAWSALDAPAPAPPVEISAHHAPEAHDPPGFADLRLTERAPSPRPAPPSGPAPVAVSPGATTLPALEVPEVPDAPLPVAAPVLVSAPDVTVPAAPAIDLDLTPPAPTDPTGL
ncbi:MAG: RNA polymerase sigma factor [Acidimicrobiales bacterium]